MPCLSSTTSTTTGSTGSPTCTENATAFIFTDHLNTPREIVRIGASAANGNNANGYTSLWRWDSLPFGDTQANDNLSGLGTTIFNHRFPGQYRDKETDLHQNWHRDYDSQLGRYVQSDPIGLEGGKNTYSFVYSAPTLTSDPTGTMTAFERWVAAMTQLVGTYLNAGDRMRMEQEIRALMAAQEAATRTAVIELLQASARAAGVLALLVLPGNIGQSTDRCRMGEVCTPPPPNVCVRPSP
jgi:RHS repeat-associated protein